MAAAGPTEAVVGLLAAAEEADGTGQVEGITLAAIILAETASPAVGITPVKMTSPMVVITPVEPTSLVARINPVRETSRPAKAQAVLQSAIWSRIPGRFSMKRTFPIK